jgi:hypothetical protein
MLAKISIVQYVGKTIILNHSREWDGKPKGLTETAGSPKYPKDIRRPGFFFVITFIEMTLSDPCAESLR